MALTWYDKHGQPLDMMIANALLGDEAYRRVGGTRITSATDPGVNYWISTVWLGLDHGRGDRPILFETMVFGDPSIEVDMRRYHTLGEAATGHAETVTLVAATVPDEVVEDDAPDST